MPGPSAETTPEERLYGLISRHWADRQAVENTHAPILVKDSLIYTIRQLDG